jgi:hypothetical protein
MTSAHPRANDIPRRAKTKSDHVISHTVQDPIVDFIDSTKRLVMTLARRVDGALIRRRRRGSRCMGGSRRGGVLGRVLGWDLACVMTFDSLSLHLLYHLMVTTSIVDVSYRVKYNQSLQKSSEIPILQM